MNIIGKSLNTKASDAEEQLELLLVAPARPSKHIAKTEDEWVSQAMKIGVTWVF